MFMPPNNIAERRGYCSLQEVLLPLELYPDAQARRTTVRSWIVRVHALVAHGLAFLRNYSMVGDRNADSGQ